MQKITKILYKGEVQCVQFWPILQTPTVQLLLYNSPRWLTLSVLFPGYTKNVLGTPQNKTCQVLTSLCPLQNPTLGALVTDGGNVFRWPTGLWSTKAKM